MMLWLQNSVLIQPRTSPLKFDDLAGRKVRYRTFQLRDFVQIDGEELEDDAEVAPVTVQPAARAVNSDGATLKSLLSAVSIKMGRSSSIARDAKGTTPRRDGHIIAESTTQQFNTVSPNIPK